jgi:hypothetical protein
MKTFTVVNDDVPVQAIGRCQKRLVCVAPGITKPVAETRLGTPVSVNTEIAVIAVMTKTVHNASISSISEDRPC